MKNYVKYLLVLCMALCAIFAVTFTACADSETNEPPISGIEQPDGGTQQPDGGTQQPDGGTQQPDGGTQQPDGGTQQPDGGTQQPDGGTQQPDGGTQQPDGGESEKLNFSGITFTDKQVTYNGEQQTIVIDGNLPVGAQVAYTNNVGVNVDEYEATAVITHSDYHTLTLNATLTIEKATFSGLTFTDKTVTYNGEQQEITVAGTLPVGTNVAYTNNKGTNANEYEATAVVTNPNYETLTLNATLTVEKATFTGVTFNHKKVGYTGKTITLTVTGELPAGTDVAYTDNTANGEGTYNATAKLTNPNYNDLTLYATLTVYDIADVAINTINTVLHRPDPWAFIPTALQKHSMAYSAQPVGGSESFANFVDVDTIGAKAIGKQFHEMYTSLTVAEGLVSKIDLVYDVAGLVAEVYQTFINDNPDNYASFEGEAGGFAFKIELTDNDYLLLAGNDTLNIELTYNGKTYVRTGRIQVTDGAAIKYQSTANSFAFSYKATVKGVGFLGEINFTRGDNGVTGNMYLHTGAKSAAIKSTAVYYSNDDYTKIASTKRESDDLLIEAYEEVYDSKTGVLLGAEVAESSIINKFDTYWFSLADVTGFENIKFVDTNDDQTPDSFMINGSSVAFEDKAVSFIDFARRYDIEMKEVWYVVATPDGDSVTYDTVKTEIPMLFVQVKHTETFASDVTGENKDTFDVTPVLPADAMEEITAQFAEMKEYLATVKENASYDDIVAFIGDKNEFFVTEE